MLLSCPDMTSIMLDIRMLLLLKIPDWSLGRNVFVTSRETNCFWTLSTVLSALSTWDLVEGSRSGMSMEKAS